MRGCSLHDPQKLLVHLRLDIDREFLRALRQQLRINEAIEDGRLDLIELLFELNILESTRLQFLEQFTLGLVVGRPEDDARVHPRDDLVKRLHAFLSDDQTRYKQ